MTTPFLPEFHELPQIDRGRFLNLKPSQRSGLSSTSGASERSEAMVPAECCVLVGRCVTTDRVGDAVVTVMELVIVETGPLLDT